MLVLLAGQVLPSIRLADALREIHAEVVESHAREKARREAAGIPLEDSTDWPKVRGHVTQLSVAVGQEQAGAARKAAQRILDEVAAPIGEVDPLVVSEAAEAVSVRLVIVSYEQQQRAVSAVRAAFVALEAAKSDHDRRQAAIRQLLDARADFVSHAVAEIVGLSHVVDGEEVPLVVEPTKGLSSAHRDVLERVSLVSTIYEVAMHAQGLDAKKALRFGRSPPST